MGLVFLGDFGAGQIQGGAAGGWGAGLRGGLDAGGGGLGEGLEVFDQDVAGVQISLQGRRHEEPAQRGAKTQPIKTGKSTCKGSAEFGKQDVGDAVSESRCLVLHNTPRPIRTPGIPPLWLRLRRAVKLDAVLASTVRAGKVLQMFSGSCLPPFIGSA